MAEIFQRHKRIVLRKCGEFIFLIDPNLSYNSDNEDILQINDIGALIWESIQEPKSVDDIVNDVLDNISDDRTISLINMVKEDVLSFLHELMINDFVGVTK